MVLSLKSCFAFSAFIYLTLASDTKCNDLKTEELYDYSCEFVIFGLHDLELSEATMSTKPKKNNEDSDLSPLEFATKIKNGQFKEGQVPFFPFYPKNKKTSEQDDLERMLVCNALLNLPGVKTRCCSILEVICPEGMVKYVIDPTHPPKNTEPPPEPIVPGPPDEVGHLVKTIARLFKGILGDNKKR